ncbi:MAG: MauE/DoxX family redox-associated membrane protein [Acidimicrobiales bacterium]
MHIARWWLTILLLSMGVAQLSDFGGFADVLASYHAFPEGSALPVALAIAVAEMAAGLGLIAGGKSRRVGAIVAVGVAVVWSVLGVQAFARGLDLSNCGCFGVHLPQRLWWGVLVQDAAFLASTLCVSRAVRPGATIPAVPDVPTLTVPNPTIRAADPLAGGSSLRENSPTRQLRR